MMSQGVTKEHTELAKNVVVYGLVARAMMSRGSEVSVSIKKLVDAYVQLFVDDEEERRRVRKVALTPVVMSVIRHYIRVIAEKSGFLSREWEIKSRHEYIFDARKMREYLNDDPRNLIEHLMGVVADA